MESENNESICTTHHILWSKNSLAHCETGYALHSHLTHYSHDKSSKQQEVTCYVDRDSNDYWVIADQYYSEFVKGPIVHNDIITLRHRATGAFLHSHNHPSPTGQQEVSCYLYHGSNDQWRVEVEGEGVWHQDSRIKLIHVKTKVALHSHKNFLPNHPKPYQQEVTGNKNRDQNDYWRYF